MSIKGAPGVHPRSKFWLLLLCPVNMIITFLSESIKLLALILLYITLHFVHELFKAPTCEFYMVLVIKNVLVRNKIKTNQNISTCQWVQNRLWLANKGVFGLTYKHTKIYWSQLKTNSGPVMNVHYLLHRLYIVLIHFHPCWRNVLQPLVANHLINSLAQGDVVVNFNSLVPGKFEQNFI